MKGLKLYKLLVTEDNEYNRPIADEIRWEGDKLLVWIPYLWLHEFIKSTRGMFGDSMFDEGGFDGNFQYDCVCIDLEKVLDGYGIDLKEIFPRILWSI